MTYALEVLTLFVGAIVMFGLLPRGVVRGRRRRPDRVQARPADLQRLEVLVGASGLSAVDTHTTLRPLLRAIAAVALDRRGVLLARDPAAARELLGDELWEIVRPGRPRPADPLARGLTLEQLANMTDRLERL